MIVFQSPGRDGLFSLVLDFLERCELGILQRRKGPHFMVANRRKYLDRTIPQRLDGLVKVTPVFRVKSSEYKVAGGDQKRRGLMGNLIDDFLAGLGVGDDGSIGFTLGKSHVAVGNKPKGVRFWIADFDVSNACVRRRSRRFVLR